MVWYYYEELSLLIFLFKCPQLFSVDNFNCQDLRGLVKWARWDIINNLNVKNVFIRFFSRKINMSFWQKCIKWIHVKNYPRKSELWHFSLAFLTLMLYFIPNQKFDLVKLHETSSQEKRQREFSVSLNLVKYSHSCETKNHRMTAYYVSILQYQFRLILDN